MDQEVRCKIYFQNTNLPEGGKKKMRVHVMHPYKGPGIWAKSNDRMISSIWQNKYCLKIQ